MLRWRALPLLHPVLASAPSPVLRATPCMTHPPLALSPSRAHHVFDVHDRRRFRRCAHLPRSCTRLDSSTPQPAAHRKSCRMAADDPPPDPRAAAGHPLDLSRLWLGLERQAYTWELSLSDASLANTDRDQCYQPSRGQAVMLSQRYARLEFDLWFRG